MAGLHVISRIAGRDGGNASKKPPPHKYWHYFFVSSLFLMLVSALALLNGYYRFVNIASYGASSLGLSPSTYLLAGYIGIFLNIFISPIPDYLLVPVYGYLCALKLFAPTNTFLVCLIAAVIPIEYVCGRYAARPLLLKALSFVHISEKRLEFAEKWIIDHGHFSIFISTFIPFFYGVACFAAGTLRMNAFYFLLASVVGFGLRYAFLEYVGYYGIYIFAASFDYSQRAAFSLLLILSIASIAAYYVRTSQFFSALNSRTAQIPKLSK